MKRIRKLKDKKEPEMFMLILINHTNFSRKIVELLCKYFVIIKISFSTLTQEYYKILLQEILNFLSLFY